VRSKDADLNGPLNTDINILLKAPIITSPTEVCVISVVSAEIPYSFYNISSNLENNILHYDATDATELNLGSSNYDINRLVSVLNTGLPVTVTWSKYTFKITFDNTTSSSFTLKFSEDPKLAQVLGFQPTDLVITPGNSNSSNGIIDLATIHSVFIKSNISTGNVLSTRLGNSSILQKVSCDVNFGGIIYQDSDDHIQRTLTTANIIDSINLKLTDQNNILLDMNGVNYELAILFSIYDTVNDTVINQDRPDRRAEVDTAVEQPGGDIDDSHVIEDETEVEQIVKTTLGDHLLDLLKEN
jgi:hypothetical protein